LQFLEFSRPEFVEIADKILQFIKTVLFQNTMSFPSYVPDRNKTRAVENFYVLRNGGRLISKFSANAFIVMLSFESIINICRRLGSAITWNASSDCVVIF